MKIIALDSSTIWTSPNLWNGHPTPERAVGDALLVSEVTTEVITRHVDIHDKIATMEPKPKPVKNKDPNPWIQECVEKITS